MSYIIIFFFFDEWLGCAYRYNVGLFITVTFQMHEEGAFYM